MGSKQKKREKETVEAMIRLYCNKNHESSENLCADCFEVNKYSIKRIENCIFGIDKPPCVECPVHCYEKGMREKIRTIMRFSGPKMIWAHPWFAVMHIIDKVIYRNKIRKGNLK